MIREGGVMERGGRDGMGWERWRGEGVVESDGGGKGGVVESDGGEREEWWTVMNRGEGWGLMEGEGVLLGHSRLCVHLSSCLWVVVMCGWHIIVRGWGLSVGGAMGAGLSVGSFMWAGCLWVLVCRSWAWW